LMFQDDCPVSCDTCHSKTVTPTSQPTYLPTLSPTCEDVTGYCELLKANYYCNKSSLLTKMKADCSYTCGYCTLQPTHLPTDDPAQQPTFARRRNPSLSERQISVDRHMLCLLVLCVSVCIFRNVYRKRINLADLGLAEVKNDLEKHKALSGGTFLELTDSDTFAALDVAKY